MRIYGTQIAITKTRSGDYCSNFHDFNNRTAQYTPPVETDARASMMLANCLQLARRKNSNDATNTMGIIWLMVSCLMHNTRKDMVYNLGYGVNWNFKAILSDEMKEYFDRCVASYNGDMYTESKNEIEIQEAKVFSINTSPAKSSSAFTSDVVDDNVEKPDVDAITCAVKDCINFFTEFDFEPNFRFLNTMSRICADGVNKAKKYIHNYFALIDSPYINDVDNKMKSPEFESIINVLSEPKNLTHKKVNQRLEIFYGAQGTGKTTLAMERAGGKAIVCNNSMLPADLMQDFDFDDGKATFKSSALYDAMVNGKTIVLDEINLLPFESLRFLQGIVDGKSSIIYKNKEIKIADGFKIIGTMNLFVNGMAYALPAPLVDRCENITEFKLTAKDLVSAIV